MDQKNFIVAIVLSVLIIVGWQYAFPPAKPPVTQQTASTQNGTPQAPTGQPGAPGTQGTVQPGAPATQPAQIVSRTGLPGATVVWLAVHSVSGPGTLIDGSAGDQPNSA